MPELYQCSRCLKTFNYSSNKCPYCGIYFAGSQSVDRPIISPEERQEIRRQDKVLVFKLLFAFLILGVLTWNYPSIKGWFVRAKNEAPFKLNQYGLQDQHSTIRSLVLTLADPALSVSDRTLAAGNLSRVNPDWKNSEGCQAALRDLIAEISDGKMVATQQELIEKRIRGYREIGSLAEVFTPVLIAAMKHRWRNEVGATVAEVGKESAYLLIEILAVYDASRRSTSQEDSANQEDLVKAGSNVEWLSRLQDERSLVFKAADKGLVPSLLVALQDKRSLVRQNAVDILSRIGANAAEAIPALTVALEDENGTVRLKAFIALRKILSNAGDDVPGVREARKALGDYTIKLNVAVKAAVAERQSMRAR